MIHNAILFANRSNLYHNGKTVTPLSHVAGVSLIERSLTALEHLGLRSITVITDVDALLAENVTQAIRSKAHLTATVRWLPAEGRVLRRIASIGSPSLLLGAELLCNPDLIAPLIERREGDLPLALVDRRVTRSFDVAGAIKARTLGSQLLETGRDLETFDALAVGVAVLPSSAIASLGQVTCWTEVLQQLAARRQLQVRDVDGAMKWHHVHSPETVAHGEWLLRAYGPELRGDQHPSQTTAGNAGMAQRVLAYIEGLLSEKRPRHNVLMNPGPVLTSPRVKSALVHHDVCHRDEDYTRVLNRVRRRLRQVCGGAEHEVVLLSGSGTAAMEATISSLVPEDKKLLVVSNGAFGERCAEIAGLHRIATVHLRHAWGELVDAQEVARALDADADIFAVMMIHHETSVGLLNPVAEVGKICRERDRLLFVDCVASLGGEDVEADRDNIDVLISSANKCLHAISGMSFVCVGPRVWERVADVRPRVYYLDLKRYREHSIPFTPAVSTCFALDAALEELLRDGVAHRVRQYRALNSRIREALARMGLRRYSETGHESHTVTLFEVPAYVSFTELYDALKSRGYVIYGCKEHLKDRFFQIANMGELSDEMVEGFLDAFEVVLNEYRERARPQLVAAAAM